MKSLVVILISLFAVRSLHAQQLNFKDNEEFTIVSHYIQKGQLNNEDNEYTFQFKVLSHDTAGYKLQCKLVKINQNVPVKLNSDSLNNTVINSSDLLSPLIILQKDFIVIVGSKGNLIINGYEPLVNQALKNWFLTPNVSQYVKGNLENYLFPLIKNLFFEWPKQKIGYGSTWTGQGNIRYDVVAIDGAVLKVAAVNPDKSWQGKYALNEVNGLAENMDITFTDTKSRQQNTYQQTIGKNATASAADTAWINMAIRLSFMSHVFEKPDRYIDSAKIFGYFKAHDERYKNDPYYNNQKLLYIQWTNVKDTHALYTQALIKTPNSVLAGQSSHLHNKLQEMMTINADSAYSVIKYFYTQYNFNEWVQDSFAQAFIGNPNAVAGQLLELLNSDKTMHIKPAINPLYTWVQAKNNSNKPAAVLTAYNSFMHMNDNYMKQGNGARYALLTYKLLVNANKQQQAAKLLLKTTQNLERYTADTLNANRYADKNMLAYAYYLNYETTNKTDQAKALQYLAKASQYSPANKNERVGASFYNSVFLKSKESYRDEFVKKLFTNGDTEQALKVFADNINAEPASIDDMENIYQKQFPGKSFKDFFVSKVMASWEDAPDFELIDFDGKKHTLADYKGKWLVFDFWGTWCSPCRAEMPNLNDFNNEIIAGKHAGINLLGAACFDNEMDVKRYLKNNQFNLTVGMGDAIHKKYKVTGFPSKVLISPNGKKFDMIYGANWQTVLEKFSELYAAN